MKQFNLEEYLANPSRNVVTRDGRSAKIICTDRKNLNYPIVALIENKYAEGEGLQCYTKEGKIYLGNGLSGVDLFFAPEKHEGWVNVYKSENNRSLGAGIWQTEEEAKKWEGAADYVTTIKIEWEE